MNNDLIILKDSKMLDNDNLQKLQVLSESIQSGFDRRQRFRPKFLMETAVLNDMKFPTPDAKYWQCNVERDTHFRNLVTLSYDYQEKVADIDILETEILHPESDHEDINTVVIAKKRIQIAREQTTLVYMKKEAEERVREIISWSEIMDGLKPKLKYDPEDVEAHMPEAYAMRYGRELEAMGVATGLSDMNGAMNIISIARSISEHESVRKLVGDDDDRKEIC